MSLTKMFLFTGVFLLLLLTVVAGQVFVLAVIKPHLSSIHKRVCKPARVFVTNFFRYSYSQVLSLSLPIPEVFAIIAFLLPLVTAVSAQTAYRFLSTGDSYARPVIYLMILAFQLIYETIIATLSLTYIAPSCRFEEQWARLYKNKEGDAIRRIQDRFNCCGLNTAVDRAWPFPHGRPEDGHGADQCERMFERVRPCLGPWRQAEQISAGLFFTVAIVIFLVKFIVLIYHVRNTSSWARLSRSITAGGLIAHHNSRTDRRLALGESDPVAAGEEYHDEFDSRPEEIAASGSGSRSRVEPSGVGIGDSVLWREGA